VGRFFCGGIRLGWALGVFSKTNFPDLFTALIFGGGKLRLSATLVFLPLEMSRLEAIL